MKDYTHLLLTSWNINANNDSIYDNAKFDAEKWMAHRELLFDSIVVPMIKAQSSKDFIWVLSFDERTPMRLINKYEKLPGIKVQIIYEMHKPWVQKSYKRYNTKWLITSRMDNDDFLWPTTIENLQQLFLNANQTCLIDFYRIFWRIEEDTFFLDNRHSPNSPFISVMEDITDGIPRTVFYDSHTTMPKHFPSQKFQQYLGVCGITSYNQIIDKVTGMPVPIDIEIRIREEMNRVGIKVPLQLKQPLKG
jgi:hypothetical protein